MKRQSIFEWIVIIGCGIYFFRSGNSITVWTILIFVLVMGLIGYFRGRKADKRYKDKLSNSVNESSTKDNNDLQYAPLKEKKKVKNKDKKSKKPKNTKAFQESSIKDSFGNTQKKKIFSYNKLDKYIEAAEKLVKSPGGISLEIEIQVANEKVLMGTFNNKSYYAGENIIRHHTYKQDNFEDPLRYIDSHDKSELYSKTKEFKDFSKTSFIF